MSWPVPSHLLPFRGYHGAAVLQSHPMLIHGSYRPSRPIKTPLSCSALEDRHPGPTWSPPTRGGDADRSQSLRQVVTSHELLHGETFLLLGPGPHGAMAWVLEFPTLAGAEAWIHAESQPRRPPLSNGVSTYRAAGRLTISPAGPGLSPESDLHSVPSSHRAVSFLPYSIIIEYGGAIFLA